MKHVQGRSRAAPRFEVCILAGGLSSRMGRDKARLRLGRRTMLGHIKVMAAQLHWPVRVIRRDLVPRCGPIGGVYTALKTTRAEAVLFLSCDMPFVGPAILKRLLRALTSKSVGVFVSPEGRGGFPFVMRTESLPQVLTAIHAQQFSLRTLAARVDARMLRLPKSEARRLTNINTPEEWAATCRAWRAPAGSDRFHS